MEMKRRILSLVLVFVIAFSFGACSALGGGAKNDAAFDGGYYGNGAMMDEAGSLAGEGYTEITENGFIKTSDAVSSYFSIDANTASYPNLRSIISGG